MALKKIILYFYHLLLHVKKSDESHWSNVLLPNQYPKFSLPASNLHVNSLPQMSVPNNPFHELSLNSTTKTFLKNSSSIS